MTEPPRPPGEGNANDPTTPFNPYAASDPTSGSTPPPPPDGYAPPPSYSPPPSSGSGYGTPPPPTSGSGYGTPPPSSGGGYGTPPPAGGYGPPPGGYNQPPQPGYGYGAPAAGQEDKTWIAVAHFGGAAGAFISGGVAGWIAPLVAFLARGPQSPAVRAESVKALNFQILWSIIGLVGWITACILIGWLAVAAAWIVGTIFGVIAGIKAGNNEPYNYPMTVSLIK
ncbi:hypothetical protein GCM10010172_33160 [Paractinoplanes ferrugineus]|uniref:DUF4870 domain-containing protein n=1 Tax=Paractinoplanes ferrugineus TaxID=113564 RepID=A0A919J649_9ACTN|nr:DUF4870 domain-containing protein [Actinoplanes ferrugineus]GIE14753.1 hypothetical protein Afe05nite_65930 [Actinoplanes ferrugineus]